MTSESLQSVLSSGLAVLLRLLLVAVLAFVATRAVRAGGRRLANRLSRSGTDIGRRSRLETLLLMGQGIARFLIVALAVLMIRLATPRWRQSSIDAP